MSEPLWQPRTDRAARWLGLGFFLGGGALLGYQVKVIVDGVAAHAERLSYFLAAIALGEMGLLLGAYWIIRGLAGYTTVRALQNDPRQRKILVVSTVVILGATIVALKVWLHSYGYD